MGFELGNWPNCQQQRKQTPESQRPSRDLRGLQARASVGFAEHQAEDCGPFYKGGMTSPQTLETLARCKGQRRPNLRPRE